MKHRHEAQHTHSRVDDSEREYGSNIYDELVEGLGDPTANKHVHGHSRQSNQLSVEQLTGEPVKKSIPAHAMAEGRLSVGELLEREHSAPIVEATDAPMTAEIETETSDAPSDDDDRMRKAEAAIAAFNQTYANGADYLAGKTREAAETAPKEAFLSALDKELAKLVEAGTLSEEAAADKKNHAAKIKATEGLFSDDPVQDAIRFAHEGLKDPSAAAEAITELDEAVGHPDDHETAATPEEASAAIEELDAAVSLPDNSNEGAKPWMASETQPMSIVTIEPESHEERKTGLISRLIERARSAKERTAKRIAEKRGLREKISGDKATQRELNRFIAEPGTIGFIMNNWSRKRREKRFKKLTKATRQLQEQSDE